MDNKRIRYAAILVLSLGEKYAADILKNVSQHDARKLISEIDKIDSISDEEFVVALNHFMTDNETTQKIESSTKDIIKNKLLSSIRTGQAGSLSSKNNPANDKWIEGIRRQPASMVLGIIRDEHPQVIAAIVMVIFNNISSDSGINIIKMLPEDLQKEILSRIAKMGVISKIAIDFISDMFREEIKEVDSSHLITVDGADTMASMMPYLKEIEAEVVTKIESENQNLGEMIAGKIFPFEKLTELDKKSLQLLLSEVSNDDLLLALKGVDPDVRETFFKSMSSKSADILKDEMESKGPIKLSTVTSAQKKIIQRAKELEKDEKIFFPGKSSDVIF